MIYKIHKSFSCGKSQFQKLMINTLNVNQNKIAQLLQNRGPYFSLYTLDAIKNIWLPNDIEKLITHNLTINQSKISTQYRQILNNHYNSQTDLIKKYDQPHYKYNISTNYKINQKKIAFKKIEEAFSIDYKNIDRLFVQVCPNQLLEVHSQDVVDWEFKNSYSLHELQAYIKGTLGQQHLIYKDGKFHLKYNQKIVLHYPPNVLLNYIVQANRYPLRVEFIDIPTLYQVEAVNSKKSLKQLEQLAELANILNIFTKMKYLQNFQNICPKCTNVDKILQLPQGYLTVLSQDKQLYNQTKVGYIVNKIIKQSLASNQNENYLVVLSEQYFEPIQDALNNYLKTGINNYKDVTSQDLRKKILNKAKNFNEQNINNQLRKSILLEFLFQTNFQDNFQGFKHFNQQLAKQYLEWYKQYEEKFSFIALNPNGQEQLNRCLEKECYALDLIFGNEKEHYQHQVSESQIYKLMQVIESQTSKVSNTNEKLKLKNKIV